MTKSIDVLIDGWNIKHPKYSKLWKSDIPENIRCGARHINRLIRVLELTKFMTPKQIETFEEGYDDQGVVIVSSLWRGRPDDFTPEDAFDKWWAHYYPLLQKEFNDDDEVLESGSEKDENDDDWIVGEAHDMFEFIFTHELDAIIII